MERKMKIEMTVRLRRNVPVGQSAGMDEVRVEPAAPMWYVCPSVIAGFVEV
jgi:hypothetical protein